MMLAHENLRVVHVSTHVSLKEACERVKKDRVLKVIKLAWEACRKIGIADPRIGVAGLNPHAGESGMFGREEIDEIIPAIQEAKALKINADGPIPPDSLFSKAKGGLYDIVVAMYHDQGHIPLKVVGFNWNDEKQKWDSISGVNITLGLPIIRSSVDHGTAFGKAGKGTASELSLVHAIEYAVKMTRNLAVQDGRGPSSKPSNDKGGCYETLYLAVIDVYVGRCDVRRPMRMGGRSRQAGLRLRLRAGGPPEPDPGQVRRAGREVQQRRG